MDVEYTWILGQEKNCRQIRLQFPLAFVSRDVYPVGGQRRKLGEIVILARYRVHSIVEQKKSGVKSK